MAHDGGLTLSINLSTGVSSTRENGQSVKKEEPRDVEDEEELQIYSSSSNSRSSATVSSKASPDTKDNSNSSRPTSSLSKRSASGTPIPKDAEEKEMITMNVPTATNKSRKRKHIVTNFDESKMLNSDALDAQRKEKERLERLERIENSLKEEDHISQVAALNHFPVVDLTGPSQQNLPLIDLTDLEREFSSPSVDSCGLGTSSSSGKAKVEHEIINLSSDDDDDINVIGSYTPRRIDPYLPSPKRGRTLDRCTVDEMERQQRMEEERLRRRGHILKATDIEKIDLNAGRLIVNKGHPPEDPDIAVAPHLTRTLQPHQLGGICFMYNNVVESQQEYKNSPGFGCILAHSMGLGKTLQIVTFTEIFFRATKAHKVLILMPVNTIQNWLAEFDKWMPKYGENGDRVRQFEVFILGDNVKTFDQRVTLLEQWHEQGGVLLIGYDMFRLLIRSTVPKKQKKKERMKLSFVNGQRIREEEEPDSFDKGFTTGGRVKKEANELIRTALLDPGPELVVCDEGHKIKSLNTDISLALGSIRTTRRVILTGYPLQNNLMEYYCMVDFVRPKYLGDKKSFSIMFEKPIKNGQCMDSTPTDVKLALQRTHILIEKLKGFVQRRTHHLLKKILPQSKEYVLLLRKSPLQHLLYRSFIIYAQSEIRNGSNVFNPLKAFAACSKIWNHPDVLAKTLAIRREKRAKEKEAQATAAASNAQNSFGASIMQALNGMAMGGLPMAQQQTNPWANMFNFGAPDLDIADVDEESGGNKRKPGRKKGETLLSVLAEELDMDLENGLKYDWAEVAMANHQLGNIEHGYKMKLTMDIVEECVRIGEKILVFSQNLTALDLIEQYLRQPNDVGVTWVKNKTYFRLDGSTNGTEREKLVNRFNSEPEIHLFLISTRAGSLGINLVSANRCIILDACWNPCHDAQAVCRVYRYGQQRRTYIYRLVMDNSMERAIFNRQIGKHGMQQRVVDDAKVDANVTQKDLETLLMYDEALDMRNSAWDTSDWDLEDDLLQKIVAKNSKMLSSMPFLHESLMIEREEGLSEQEKREAQLMFERERRGETVPPTGLIPNGMSSRMPQHWPSMQNNYNTYDYNNSASLRSTPMPFQMQMPDRVANTDLYQSALFANRIRGNDPGRQMQQQNTQFMAPDFNGGMFPPSHSMFPPQSYQMNSYDNSLPQDPFPTTTAIYTFHDGSTAAPGSAFPGASAAGPVVRSHSGSIRHIVLDRDITLAYAGQYGQTANFKAGQEVDLVQSGERMFLKANNALFDASGSVFDPNSQSIFSPPLLPQLGPADLIELD